MASAPMSSRTAALRAIIRSHKRWDIVFGFVGLAAMSVGILTLVALFAQMFVQGFPRITADFFTHFPSRRAGEAGILSSVPGAERNGAELVAGI